ncbi:RTA1 like protein-domain-containing protein [Dactylonectria estremocensis]|uniref:RTA1 like protein-domain-containing protein n=1 Tax=Dactylonectria estremocensis TaxID=1079267 RepID=A0A9P9IK04_9HYPO|nr:RTA1 like protein-domain-containing protein [Dactylonectria estremocensis]
MAGSGTEDDAIFSLYRYDPSMAAAVIFIVLFMAITGLHLYQLIVTKTWFFAWFVAGGFMQFIGYIGRAASSSESPNWTVKPYVVQTLLLLISPALFAASIYMILGRIILVVDGESYSPIRRVWLTKLFVLGDVLSFCLQGAGGGMMAAGTLEALHNGERIVIIGLIIQIVFFSLFAVTAAVFYMRFSGALSTKALASGIPWQKYLVVLFIAAGLIMVRSVFRLIEYAQGNAGYLISHEAYLYIFDSLLMFLTMALFAWEHPSQLNAKLRGGGTAVRRGIRLYWEK